MCSPGGQTQSLGHARQDLSQPRYSLSLQSYCLQNHQYHSTTEGIRGVGSESAHSPTLCLHQSVSTAAQCSDLDKESLTPTQAAAQCGKLLSSHAYHRLSPHFEEASASKFKFCPQQALPHSAMVGKWFIRQQGRPLESHQTQESSFSCGQLPPLCVNVWVEV